MSFMTARRPSANRVWHNGHILSSAIPTWAHALGAAGYETALIGRMHFVGPDQRHGFEKRPIAEYFAPHPGADRLGAPLFQAIPTATTGQLRIAAECAGRGRTSYQAFDEMVAEAACAYLHEKAREPEKRPFAAVAGFVLPHCPFFAPRELFDYYYERVDVPVPSPDEEAREPAVVRRFKRLRGLYPALPEERIRVARAAYLGICEYFDLQVGRVLEALRQSGLDRNTLVIYCSDHGEMAGEHGCWWKSNYYEGSVGVPLIASLPGVVPEGIADPTVCNLMDLAPTLVEMAGAAPMPAIDGRSLWAAFTGADDLDRPDETFSELCDPTEAVPSRMIRKGPWKLYKYHDTTPAVLYNLEMDPAEQIDLGKDSRYEGELRDLLGRLYRDWDPERVVRETADLDRDLEPIKRWGRAVQPRHEDALPVPEGAEDVEPL
jgi:choline-sulfatase